MRILYARLIDSKVGVNIPEPGEGLVVVRLRSRFNEMVEVMRGEATVKARARLEREKRTPWLLEVKQLIRRCASQASRYHRSLAWRYGLLNPDLGLEYAASVATEYLRGLLRFHIRLAAAKRSKLYDYLLVNGASLLALHENISRLEDPQQVKHLVPYVWKSKDKTFLTKLLNEVKPYWERYTTLIQEVQKLIERGTNQA